MGRLTSRYTTVRVEDANGLGMTVGPGEGNFAWDPVNHGNTTKIRVDDRSRFDCIVEGADLDQTWSIDTKMPQQTITDLTDINDRLQDFLLKQGKFANAASVSSNPNIWAFIVKVTMELSAGGALTEYKFPHNIADYGFAEAADGHGIALSGINNGAMLRDGRAVPVN